MSRNKWFAVRIGVYAVLCVLNELGLKGAVDTTLLIVACLDSARFWLFYEDKKSDFDKTPEIGK